MGEVQGKILAGKILVKPKERQKETASGILLGNTGKEKQTEGTVVMVGENTKNEIIEVKVGDEILFNKSYGKVVPIDGVDYILITSFEILYIL